MVEGLRRSKVSLTLEAVMAVMAVRAGSASLGKLDLGVGGFALAYGPSSRGGSIFWP